MKAIRRFSVRTVLPAPIAALGDLASNLRWSWHPPTRDLFERIDPQRWAKVRKDPVRLLSALSPAELAALAADAEFVTAVAAAKADLDIFASFTVFFIAVPASSTVSAILLPRLSFVFDIIYFLDE